MSNLLLDFNINRFQDNLITWFEQQQRDLPWRENQDPYRVWVSEIMLQQTRVETVIPYFNNFVEQFPTIDALAEADEERVLKAWEGLGYYSRVRNLQTAVKEVKEEYGGKVPNTRKEISKLKGVGPYTAGAILSIAYGKPEHAVDGNVMRVLSRVLLVREDIAKVKTRKIFEEAVSGLISEEKPSQFNQGLMELGALICTPTSPGCLLCPVREHCRAYHEGVQNELPIKAKKKKPKKKEMAAIVLQDGEGNILIHRRGEDGLLARLWEFPNHETIHSENQKDELKQFLHESYDVQGIVEENFLIVEHVFSHLIWHITVYKGTVLKKGSTGENLRWVQKKDLENHPFPVSHQKIIGELLKKG
ncbi:A/G-specific adenine glycosylase [Bacillus sp. FJAT-45350]|uniref:A/G-specific adenine glycosylase n=1 Tax=Bacillus sp. FJAT-45350 TaxID=2011014 RepID=UPI00211B7459|nr:A/G-specific adenine glycosylase [Bacillus sp. FJAT-45350]